MRVRGQSRERWVVAAALLVLAACGGSAEPHEGEGVPIEPEDMSIVEVPESAATPEVATGSESAPAPAPPSTPAPSRAAGSATAPRSSTSAQSPVETSAPEPPAPVRVVAIPAGTTIPAAMETSLSTRTHKVGDIFHARVTEEILASDGMVLVPQGARLEGRVAEASQSSSSQEEALLLLTFEHLLIMGERFPIDAVVTEVAMQTSAQASGARTAATVATGAAAGAVVGRILGGDRRSTVAGAVVGAVAGTGVALTTRDGHATIDEGARVVVRLDSPTTLGGR